MKIPLKNAAELDAMRESCRMTASVLEQVAAAVQPGVTTGELDALTRRLIAGMNAKPSFGLPGVPGSDMHFHQRRSDSRHPWATGCHAGDVVSLDVGVYYKGFHGDSATTVTVGVTDPM